MAICLQRWGIRIQYDPFPSSSNPCPPVPCFSFLLFLSLLSPSGTHPLIQLGSLRSAMSFPADSGGARSPNALWCFLGWISSLWWQNQVNHLFVSQLEFWTDIVHKLAKVLWGLLISWLNVGCPVITGHHLGPYGQWPVYGGGGGEAYGHLQILNVIRHSCNISKQDVASPMSDFQNSDETKDWLKSGHCWSNMM